MLVEEVPSSFAKYHSGGRENHSLTFIASGGVEISVGTICTTTFLFCFNFYFLDLVYLACTAVLGIFGKKKTISQEQKQF